MTDWTNFWARLNFFKTFAGQTNYAKLSKNTSLTSEKNIMYQKQFKKKINRVCTFLGRVKKKTFPNLRYSRNSYVIWTLSTDGVFYWILFENFDFKSRVTIWRARKHFYKVSCACIRFQLSLLSFTNDCMEEKRWKSYFCWNFVDFSLILVKLGTFTWKAKKNPICRQSCVFFEQKKIKNWIQVSKRKILIYFFSGTLKSF